MTVVFGWVISVVGVISIILGMLGGAREIFRRQQEPGALAALPDALLKLLGKLIEAPTHKMLFVGGILLLAVGLALTGVPALTDGSA